MNTRVQSKGFNILSPVNESSRNEEDDNNSNYQIYNNKSIEYINLLKEQQSHSYQLLNKDIQQTTKLLKHLPIHERYTLNKEGKVLTLWQERLNNWEKIKSNIITKLSKKLNNKKYNKKSIIKSSLLMSLTDDYRPKIEEYDLIQAAVPPDDFNGEFGWQKSLRGGGSVKVAIGNIYSGLECETERQILPPIMIRKPKPTDDNINKSSTIFLEQTEGYIKKKKLLNKEIATIRPHILSYENAEALVINATDLFQWAIDSSIDYFNQQKQYTNNNINQDSKLDNKINSNIDSDADSTVDSKKSIIPICQLEYLSSLDLIVETNPNNISNVTISYRNTGRTAIQYEWKHVNKHPNNQTLVYNNIFNNPLISKEVLLINQRVQFYCSKPIGIILPNELVNITFSYINSYITGTYCEDWLLDCTPHTTISLSNELNNKLVGKLVIHLHSYNINDFNTNEYMNQQITRQIITNDIHNYISDILNYCIDRLRKPITTDIITTRIISYFKSINEKYLTNQSYNYITISNIQSFYKLYLKLLDIYKYTAIIYINMTHYEQLEDRLIDKSKLNHLINIYVNGLIDSSSYLLDNLIEENKNIYTDDVMTDLYQKLDGYKDTNTITIIKNEFLFPELHIEVFDEIIEEDITPQWNYSIQNIYNILDDIKQMSKNISDIESSIQQRLALFDKEQLKQHRADILRLRQEERQRRLKERDDDSDIDDDDDIDEFEQQLENDLNVLFPIDFNEEEDNEENDNDDDNDLVTVVIEHPLIKQSSLLLAECSGSILKLIIPELPYNEFYTITSQLLYNSIDKISDIKENAQTKSNLNKNVEHQPYLSPFTTVEGQVDWDNAISLSNQSTTINLKKTEKKASKDNMPSKEQIAVYYNSIYESISQLLYEMIDDMFTSIDQSLSNHHNNTLQQSNYDSISIFDIPTIRITDLTNNIEVIDQPLVNDYYNKVVYINVSSNLFDNNSYFNISDVKCKQLIKYIIDLTNYGSRGIVLLSDNISNQSTNYLHNIKQMIDKNLSNILDEINLYHNKYYNKNILIEYNIQIIESISQLKYKLTEYLKNEKDFILSKLDSKVDSKSTGKSKSKRKVKRLIPIYLVNDLNLPNVIPNDIPPEIIESDDDEPPIDLAIDEFKQDIINKWIESKPHKVVCALDNGVDIDVYADKKAALLDVYNLPNHILPTVDNYNYSVWVDDNITSSISTYVPNKFISKYYREMFIWCGILNLLPLTLTNYKPIDVTIQSTYDNDSQRDRCIFKQLDRLFPHLYNYQYISDQINKTKEVEIANSKKDKRKGSSVVEPTSVVTQKAVNKIESMAIIGGKLRDDKLQFIYKLIDLVDVIYLSGEVCIPFISYLHQIKLVRYVDICNNYILICKQIISKARMRGVKLVIPSDLNVGDELIESIDTLQYNNSVSFGESISCDEGYDYKGDNINISIDNQINIIDGYIYDLGKYSIDSLNQLIASCDMLIMWGLTGICEYSIYQTSFRLLVEKTNNKPYSNRSTISIEKQLHTLLLGESTVEWYSRIIDSDGEYSGDLANAGIVSYVNRDSKLFTKIISLIPDSHLIDGFIRRVSSDNEDEWIFNGPPPPEKDDDEDD